MGRPALKSVHSAESMQLAASVAAKSNHPLCKSLASYCTGNILNLDVVEEKGKGLVSGNIKLGSAAFIGAVPANDANMEIWLQNANSAPERFVFTDEVRLDARETILELKKNYDVYLLSGDRELAVKQLAADLNITNYKSQVSPIDKAKFIEALGHNTLMIGDGLNDAAALKTASVSISPSTALDIAQNSADIILQGAKLLPVISALQTAKYASKLVRQNFYMAIGYNLIAIPVAFAGLASPLVAAIAMSGSSIAVVLNSLRISEWR
jgi:Cu2+-exporting ATPase